VLEPGRVREEPGPAWCRAWTDVVDGVLSELHAGARAERPVSVIALGSYARRELCPASDIDLLILHDGWRTEGLQALVQALCYPLWDAGLSVGHAVRTVRECVSSAAERVDTATALTDRRLVAGDAGLADAVGDRLGRWLRRNGGSVLTDLATADGRRHARAGAHPGVLEPDLKDTAGGLRDLHSLRWAAACVLGEVGLDPLVGARYLSAADRAELATAGAELLAARCALHLVQGTGARDVLRLDLQDEVAARLGLPDGDVLLHRVGLAARGIAHVHGRTWAPLLSDATGGRRRRRPPPEEVDDGIAIDDGLVEITADEELPDRPSLGLRAVAAAAERGTHLGRRTAARLARGAREAAPLAWDDESRAALLRTLRTGSTGLGAMGDADHLGLLTAHLPEWGRIRGRPQRNPYHRFDLDTHGVQAVCELVAIADGSDGPERARLFGGLPDPGVVLLGTLLHDVGKAWAGDHSLVGAEIAARWVVEMGFPPAHADVVARLIRHHLLLPDVATRRDIDDPTEVEAVARAVRDPELLDALYLLTLADARATGPSAHSPWKDGLIADLHARARGVLASDVAALQSAFDPRVAAAQALHAAEVGAGPDPAAVAAMLRGLDERYVLAAGPAQCAVHAALLAPPPEPGDLRASWRDGDVGGTRILSVVGVDRLGFIADCTGVLAGHGLRVLDARAFTRSAEDSADLALDWFVVDATTPFDDAAVVADLQRVAAGEVRAVDLVASRERRRGERPPVLAEPVALDVAIDVGGETVRIEVHAPDAPGVLSRLAAVLASEGLGVVGARVTTLGPEVRDVFFVRRPAEPPAGGWDRLADRLREAGRLPG
jgi:[protein-PII] uridylyltransferase